MQSAVAPAAWVAKYCAAIIPAAAALAAMSKPVDISDNEQVGEAAAYLRVLAQSEKALADAEAVPLTSDFPVTGSFMRVSSAQAGWTASEVEKLRLKVSQASTPADAKALWDDAMNNGNFPAPPADIAAPADVAAIQNGRVQLDREGGELNAYFTAIPGCVEAQSALH